MDWSNFIEELGFKEGLTTGTVCAALVLGGCWIWATKTSAFLPEVVAAAGTVGATLAAVWLAYRTDRREKKNKYELATLHAASFAALIEDEVIRPLESAVAQLQFSLAPIPGHAPVSSEVINRRLQGFGKALEKASSLISADDLAPLIGLQRSVAHRAAFGIAGLSRISRQFNRATSRNSLTNEGLLVSNPSDYLAETVRSIQYLSAAMRECRLASYKSAPTPSVDEVHGKYEG